MAFAPPVGRETEGSDARAEVGESRSLGYQSRLDTSREAHPRRRSVLVRVLVYCGLLVLLATMFAPLLSIGRRRPGSSMSVKCMSNLRQIGIAIQMYENDHGVCPGSLAELTHYLGPSMRVFVCPASHDTTATGPTTQAAVASLTTGGHLSYVYVGAGLAKAAVKPNTVLAYESVGNHNGKSNVLYGDLHVATVPATLLPTLLRSGTATSLSHP